LELKRHQEYQDLKRLVMDQAPSSNFKKGTEEAVRVKMAVAYRDYMKGGWSSGRYQSGRYPGCQVANRAGS
jgi:hypothetical protein